MDEKNISNNSEMSGIGDELGFMLFLVFILLLMSSPNGKFNSYFNVFDKELNKIQNILEAYYTTANSLKGVFNVSE
ncbi:MAG: hypothetical protein ACOCRZ_00705 [Halothermotrichaceae bacterium]